MRAMSSIRRAVVMSDGHCASCGTRDDYSDKYCVTCGARLLAPPDAISFFKRTKGTQVATMRAYTADVLESEDARSPR